VQDSNFSKISKDDVDSEATKSNKPDLIPRPDWEKYCSKVAERIVSEQSPDRLYEVRGMLYELLVHCIPPNVVISVRAPRQQAGSSLTDPS
jgi:replication factor C subunit 3/5